MNELQLTDEWFADKLGKVSASNINAVMAEVKSGEATTRRNYKARLIAERLTGITQETYTSPDMALGIERERNAKACYAFTRSVSVNNIGFVFHPEIINAGASPDGLIGEDGLVEVKCPKVATHLFDYVIDEKIINKYIQQMQFQMACTGREWCDFVSYSPDLSPDLQLYIKRFPRDNKLIEEIEFKVKDFLDEVDELMEELTSKKGD